MKQICPIKALRVFVIAFGALTLGMGCAEVPPVDPSKTIASPDPVVQMQAQIADVDQQLSTMYGRMPSDRRDWKDSETEAITLLSKRRDTLREQQTRLIILLSKKDAQGKPVELNDTQALLRKLQEEIPPPPTQSVKNTVAH